MIQIIYNILLLGSVMWEASAKRQNAAQLYAHDPDGEPSLSSPSDRSNGSPPHGKPHRRGDERQGGHFRPSALQQWLIFLHKRCCLFLRWL